MENDCISMSRRSSAFSDTFSISLRVVALSESLLGEWDSRGRSNRSSGGLSDTHTLSVTKMQKRYIDKRVYRFI